MVVFFQWQIVCVQREPGTFDYLRIGCDELQYRGKGAKEQPRIQTDNVWAGAIGVTLLSKIYTSSTNSHIPGYTGEMSVQETLQEALSSTLELPS